MNCADYFCLISLPSQPPASGSRCTPPLTLWDWVDCLQVYDRWSGLVFERRGFAAGDESAGWEGTWRGQRVQPGMYVWQAGIRLTGGAVLRKSGDVTALE